MKGCLYCRRFRQHPHLSATTAGAFLGISELVFCTAVLATAKFRLGPGIEALRTVAFIAIVFGNQATTYSNRELLRMGSCSSKPVAGRIFSSRPADCIDSGDFRNCLALSWLSSWQ